MLPPSPSCAPPDALPCTHNSACSGSPSSSVTRWPSSGSARSTGTPTWTPGSPNNACKGYGVATRVLSVPACCADTSLCLCFVATPGGEGPAEGPAAGGGHASGVRRGHPVQLPVPGVCGRAVGETASPGDVSCSNRRVSNERDGFIGSTLSLVSTLVCRLGRAGAQDWARGGHSARRGPGARGFDD